MKRMILIGGLVAAGMLASQSANATNLVQVYQQATSADPTYAKAQAAWLLAKAQVPILMGKSFLLPSFTLSSGIAANYGKPAAPGNKEHYQTSNVGATLKQSLFDLSAWSQLRGAKYSVKAAAASYAAAAQGLMFRTAQAYFQVLKDSETLRYTEANKESVLRQLITNRQKYRVGLIAITSVYEAQSAYDTQVANEIAARNTLANDLENLRAITGVHYSHLMGLSKQVPLVTPKPANINDWVNTSQKQNLVLQADEYSVLANKQNLQGADSSMLPTVLLTGTAGVGKTNITGENKDQRTASAGINISFPIFQGGGIRGNTEAAKANLLTSSAQLEFDHRAQVNLTRQSYLGVLSGKSKIKADYQAILSARKALQATRAGYIVGTRTMVDVLTDMTTLYSAQKQYSSDQYDYIMNLISLKQAAGTLDIKDLVGINHWLTRSYAVAKQSQPQQYPMHSATHHNTHATTHSAVHKHAKAHTAMTGNYYTLQLFASGSHAGAKAFLKPLHDKSLSIVKQGHYYKVVRGHYATRAQANAALKVIPQRYRIYQPWVYKVH